MMGTPESEEGRDQDETLHIVTLTKGYWMMETEVTQKQWTAIMGNNPSYFKDDDLPVENVSWDDCQKFCKKCTERGLPFQLPTEALWEKACRAGTADAYPDEVDKIAWYDLNSCGKTHPVKMKKPNTLGLYDMNGNVWKWRLDCYVKDYPTRQVTDPTSPLSSNSICQFVHRGGSWDMKVIHSRSVDRGLERPDVRQNRFGFRCVIVP